MDGKIDGQGPVSPRPLLKGLALIATLVALGWAVEASGLSLDESWIDAQVRGQGLRGEALFVAMAAAAVAMGVPRQIAAFLGGYAFGAVAGGGLALLAVVLGCIADFGAARLVGRDLVQRRLGGRIARFDAFLRDNTFVAALLLRLMPAGANQLISAAAGVSSVRPLPFFAGSALGYVPQTVIFALLGSGVTVEPELRITAGVVLFLASGVLGLHLYRRMRRESAPLPTSSTVC